MENKVEDSWRGEERRNGNWSLGKEIFGTMVAIAPFAIAFFVWITGIDKQTTINTLEIAHLQAARSEIVTKLDKISDQVSSVQQTVAKIK